MLRVSFLTLVFITFMSTALASDNTSESEEKLLKAFRLINNHYVGPSNPRELSEIAIKAMITSLDTYSQYYPPVAFSGEINEHQGNGYGVGFVVTSGQNHPIVAFILRNSPADKAGIRVGSKLISVNGKSTDAVSLKELNNELNNKAPNTKTLLTLQNNSQILEIALNNSEVERVDILASYQAQTITLLIKQFSLLTANHITEWLMQLYTRHPTAKLIIDLRNNPGGSMRGARQSAGLFLTKNSLLGSYLGKNKAVLNRFKTKADGVFSSSEIEIIINEDTASAAEFFAGALKGKPGVRITGKPSRGKGTIQTFYELGDTSGISISTKKMVTSQDIEIEANGIKPDTQ